MLHSNTCTQSTIKALRGNLNLESWERVIQSKNVLSLPIMVSGNKFLRQKYDGK